MTLRLKNCAPSAAQASDKSGVASVSFAGEAPAPVTFSVSSATARSVRDAAEYLGILRERPKTGKAQRKQRIRVKQLERELSREFGIA
jgi:hypothetical protein